MTRLVPQNSGKKMIFPINGPGMTGNLHGRKQNWVLPPTNKISVSRDCGLNAKGKTINFLKDNITQYFLVIEVGNYF